MTATDLFTTTQTASNVLQAERVCRRIAVTVGVQMEEGADLCHFHSLSRLVRQCEFVGGAEGEVEAEEGERLLPHRLVDGAAPAEKDFEESRHTRGRHVQTVGDSHAGLGWTRTRPDEVVSSPDVSAVFCD